MSIVVNRVVVPDRSGLAALAQLERADYADAFSVDTDATLSPEQWLRLVIVDSPMVIRAPVMGMFLVGAHLTWPLNSENSMLGWRRMSSTPEHCVAGVDTRIGLTGRLVALTPPGGAMIVTAVQIDTVVARRIWAVGQRLHRRVVPAFLANAARLASTRA